MLVIAIAVRKWNEYLRENKAYVEENETAAQRFANYLDSFVDLYRNHRALLRFNQFFNIYLQREQVETEVLQPYQEVIRSLAERFYRMYKKAEEDHTLRTDIPVEEFFSVTLHLMLAAATRYAVGLVYRTGDPEQELELLRAMLLSRFTTP